MPATKHLPPRKIPQRFEELVRHMPPQAIVDDVQHDNALEMIDQLMQVSRLTRGQSLYLETWVQLVEAYEGDAMDGSDLHGMDSLKHLLEENGLNASDLARLLGIHASMGSKILKGERALTVDHLRKLAERFKVSPALFIDCLP